MTAFTKMHHSPTGLLGAALASVLLVAALLALPASAGASRPVRHRPAAHHQAAHHHARTATRHKAAGHTHRKPAKHAHKKAAAASGALLPRSTVIARDPARHTLVVAGTGGVARTLRLAKARQVRSTRLGTVVAARAVHLADGTYRVVRLTRHGHRRRALVRATVVDTTARTLLLSAGGSVFRVRDPKLTTAHVVLARATAPSPTTGEVLRARVAITNTSLDVNQSGIKPLGTASLVSLQGILQGITGTALTIAVSQGAITTVTIPPSITIPSTIAAGDQVEVLAAYANGAFSLVTIRDDKLAATATSQGVTQPATGSTRRLEVEGVVSSVSGSTVVIQPGDGAAPVTVTVPSTVSLAGVAAGSRVHVAAGMSQGTLTAVGLRLQHPEGGDHGSSPSPGNGANPPSTSPDHHSGDHHSGGDGSGSTSLTGTATTITSTTTSVSTLPPPVHHGDGGDGNNNGNNSGGGGDN